MLGELIRTDMGIYIVKDDDSLGPEVAYYHTLEIPRNLSDLVVVAPVIPEGGVVIDAGACIGDHTCTYSQMVGPLGHVFAFEPHPASYQALVKNTARLNNVTAFPYALSDHWGDVELQITPNVGASFLSGETHDWPSVIVPCCTLDTQLLPILSRCDFLHLDAEGTEPAILRGAHGLIARFHPVLLIEVTDQWLKRAGSSEAELLALLRGYGYDFRRLQANPAQYDVLALPPERHFIDTPPVVVDTVASA